MRTRHLLTVAVLLCIGAGAVAQGDAAGPSAAPADGSVLPFPPVPSASVAQPRVQDSVHTRRVEPQHLKEIAGLMKREPRLMAQLGGFADPRGTAPHNLELSDRRVKAVVDAVVAWGVVATRFQTAAMGQKSRNCPEPTEECYRKNRRVEVQIRPRGQLVRVIR